MVLVVNASLSADEVTRALLTNGWVAMSYEELLVRRHYDSLGYAKEPKPSTVDRYHLEHLFIQLGICKTNLDARHLVESVVDRLVGLGFLRTSSYSGGQCTFLAQPKLSLTEAVSELRKKLEENRA